MKRIFIHIIIVTILLIKTADVFSQPYLGYDSPRPEPTSEQPPASADIDALNPLRYIDTSVEWIITTINDGIDSAINYLRLAEEGISKFIMHTRFRHKWQEQVDFNFNRNVYDRQILHNQFWRFGITTVTTEIRIDFELMHALELYSTRLFDKKDEDSWDIHRLTVTLTGFTGERIRFPVPFSSSWANLIALVGRGPLTFGKGRLLGSNDSPNIGDSFESAIIAFREENTAASMTLFGVRRVNYINRTLNEGDTDTYLFGLSLIGLDPLNQSLFQAGLENRTLLRAGEYDFDFFPAVNPKELRSALGFDVYILWAKHLKEDIEGELDRVGDYNFLNLGIRAGIELFTNWTFEFEGNYQFGRYANSNMYAQAIHTQLNGGFDWFFPFSFTLSLDYASGDNNPNDGKIHTFYDLFAKSDRRFGGFNFFGWRNLIHIGAEARIQIANTLLIQGGYHKLENVTGKDAVYAPRGDIMLARGVNPDFVSLGTVFDLEIHYHYSKRIHLYAGVSYFIPSSKFKQSNLSDNAIQYYCSAEVRFQ